MRSLPKPAWLKKRLPKGGKNIKEVENLLQGFNLHSVCEEANCPNRSECFALKTATFMILGDICTRNCRFCAVKKGRPLPLDAAEPFHLAQAAQVLALQHIVVTSVTRDDLQDGGAEQFAKVTRYLKEVLPECTVELLIPDLCGNWEALKVIVDACPDILNHNIETVPSLYSAVRPGAKYARSLQLLKQAKELNGSLITKSGIMVGLGEETDEVAAVMEDLRKVGCDMLTIGQYLQPSPQHLAVAEYIHPDQFAAYKEIALEKGFLFVAAGPFVRSSYHALEGMREVIDKSKVL